MSKRDVMLPVQVFNHERAIIAWRLLDKAPKCKPYIVNTEKSPVSRIAHYPLMPFLTYCGNNAARVIGGQAPVIHGAN